MRSLDKSILQLGLSGLIVIIATFLTRFLSNHTTHSTAQDIVSYVVMGLYLVCMAILFLPAMMPETFPDVSETGIRAFSVILVLASVVMLLGVTLSSPEIQKTAQDLYRRFYNVVGPSITIIGTIILALAGYGLFLLRERRLIVYAYAEITFALTSCYVAVDRSKQGGGMGTLTVIGGAVYLVVRGLDNRQKAMSILKECLTEQ